MSTTTEQQSITVTGDSRVDANLRALALMIVESPLISSFIKAVDELNAEVSVTESVIHQRGMDMIAAPETLKALLTLSELNKIRQTLVDDKKEMIQEFITVSGDRLQQVLLHLFTPMGINASTMHIKQLPPAIEIWVRPDIYAPQFEAIRKAIACGHLATKTKASNVA